MNNYNGEPLLLFQDYAATETVVTDMAMCGNVWQLAERKQTMIKLTEC